MDGKPANLDTLLSEHGWMRALARQLVLDEASADDLVQQTWVDVLRAPPVVTAGRARGFLATVLRRRAAKQHRERMRRERRETIAAAPDSQPSAESLAAEVDAQRELVETVLALDEPYRETVILRWFKELTPSEIAKDRGIPVGTVETRLKRAHAKLREELTRRSGGDRERWVVGLMPLAARRLVAVASFSIGAILVSKTFVASAAAVLAIVTAALWIHTESDRSPREQPGAIAPKSPDAPRLQGDAAVREAVGDRDRVATSAASALELCRLRVVDADGGSVAKAELYIDARESTVEPLTTDENGEVSLSRLPGESDVYVMAQRHAPSRHRVSLALASSEIRLDRGHAISGLVLADDLPPRHPLRVSLYPARPFRLVAQAPPAIYDRIRRSSFNDWLEVDTDAQGRFSFDGFSEGDEVGLSLNSQFYDTRLDGSFRAHARAPASGVVLRVEAHPVIIGRILEPDGTPATLANIKFQSANPEAGHGHSGWLSKTDAGGRFEYPIPLESATWIELDAADPQHARLHRRFDGPFPKEYSVGDLKLVAPKSILFRALDEAGKPIAGAIAVATSDPRLRGAPTAEDGLGSIDLSAADLEKPIAVYAPRYDGALLRDEPRDGDGRRRVVLSLATHLVVRLAPRGAPWRPYMSLEIESHDAVALARGELDAAILAATDGGAFNVADDFVMCYASFGKDGKFEIDRLAPHVSWTLTVRDGATVLGTQSVVLQAGESREIDITVTKAPHALTGIVLDKNRDPVRGATVVAITRNDPSNPQIDPERTDANGRFRVAGLFADRCDLNVIHSEFAWKRVAGVALGPSTTDIEIVLDAGAVAQCRVIDGDGAPVVGATVELGLGGWRNEALAPSDDPIDDADTSLANDLGDGRYRFDGHYAGKHEGRVRIGGGMTPFTLDPSQSETIVRVPSTGSLVIHRDFAIDGYAHRIRLLRDGGGEQLVDDILIAPNQTSRDETVKHVLPGNYTVVLERSEDGNTWREIARAANVVVAARAEGRAVLTR